MKLEGGRGGSLQFVSFGFDVVVRAAGGGVLAIPPVSAVEDGGGSADVTNRLLSDVRVPEPVDVPVGVDAAPKRFADLVEARRDAFAELEVRVSVSGSGGVAKIDGLPLEVVVPSEVGRQSTDIRLETASPEVARVLSPLGLAFSLEVATVGGPKLPAPSESFTDGLGKSESVVPPRADAKPALGGKVESSPAEVELRDGDLTLVGSDPSLATGVAAVPVGLDEPVGEDDLVDLDVDDTPSGWQVRVDASGFGLDAVELAELGSRLTLEYWSGCDDGGSCAAHRTLPSSFDVESGVLVADIPRQVLADFARVNLSTAGGRVDGSALVTHGSSTLLSVGSSSSGPSGDFGASAFASRSSFDVGISTGTAAASYDFDLPPAVGPVPQLGLSYSSGSVDGLNTSVNTQPGVAGLGWDLSRATITRQTRACTGSQEGNLCLVNGDENDAFSLSLNGVGGRLARTGVTGTDTTVGEFGQFGAYEEYDLQEDPSLRIRRFEYGTNARRIVAVESTPSGDGYWVVNRSGAVQAFGDAVHYGNAPGGLTNIVDIARTSNGAGYWLVGSDGGVFAFGNAGFYGSLPGWNPPIVVNNIVAIAPRSDNAGYWLAGADGGIFAFSAGYYGNVTSSLSGGDTVIDLAGDGTTGYWALSVNGGVFAFGSAGFFGASTATDLRGIEATGTGNGYWLVNLWGNVSAHGDAQLSDIGELSVSYATVDIARAGSTAGLFVAEMYGRVSPMDGAIWTPASALDVKGTWFEVTTTDGTKYYFGTGFEPGSTEQTNSVRHAPVWDTTKPPGSTCSWNLCDYALSWDLDRIVDTSGNAVSLFYEPEANWFKSQVVTGVFKSRGYLRSSVLTRIEYGFEAGQEAITPFQASLGYTARCITDAGFVNCEQSGGVDIYPDTPTDLNCLGWAPCANQSPAFYTYYRLSNVTTRVRNSAGTGFDDVKTWVLRHLFPDPDTNPNSDDSVRKLWLNAIFEQSGFTGDALPPVVYSPVMLDNRVNSPGAISPMAMPRLSSILNEFGGLLTVNYGQSHPYGGSTGGCNPPPDNIRPDCDAFIGYDAYTGTGGFVWWNKWKVLSTSNDPRFGGSPPMVTSYEYLTPPQWRYSERFGLTATDAAQCLTTGDCNLWNQFQGHQQVKVTTGDGTASTYYFYTGMDGDRTSGTNTAPIVANQVDSDNVSRADRLEFTGRVSDVVVEDAVTGLRQFRQLNLYGRGAATGASWPFSRLVWQSATYPTSYEDDGINWSRSKTTWTVDGYGNIVYAYDWGDYPACCDNGDEYTTATTYNYDTAKHIVSRPSQSTYYATRSSTIPQNGAILARTEWDYFSGTDLIEEQRVSIGIGAGGVTDWSATNYLVDGRGRTTKITDAAGAVIDYTYNPTYGGLATETASLLGTTTYTVDPKFGNVTQASRNGITTSVTYDGLGRTKTVTGPGDPKASVKYTYAIHDHQGNQALTSVQPAILLVETLRENNASTFEYTGGWTFFDGLARTLQIQTIDTNTTADRVLTTTQYDAAGRVTKQSAPTHNATPAGNGFSLVDWSTQLSYTETVYPTGRDVSTSAMSGNTASWTSMVNNAEYDTTVTDPNGNVTVNERDHRGRLTRVTDANSKVTDYSYDDHNRLTLVDPPQPGGLPSTDITIAYANGSPWKTSMVDPDTGTWKYVYDDFGRVTAQRDGKGRWLMFTYDVLGRQTKLHDGGTGGSAVQGAELSRWNYRTSTTSPDVGLMVDSIARFNTADEIKITNAYDQASLELSQRTWDIDAAPATYSFGYSYRDSGAVDAITYPDGEIVTHIYNEVEAPTGLSSSLFGSIVAAASYTPWGASSSMLVGSGAGQVSTVRVYDQASLRLDSLTSTVGVVDVVDYSFEFDDGGNLTRLADTGLGVSGGPQYQCYSYDVLDRLTAAYTTTTAAGSGCGGLNTSGSDPYSNSWSYNDIGNMISASGPGTATGGYTYGAGIAGPHAVTTAGSNTYSYDTAGNQTVRTVAGNAVQTLGYDVQNRLDTITENSTAVGEYEYDADGVRTVVTNNGVTTFVIGEVYEVTPGTPTVERVSYRFGGQTVGYNDGAGLRALAAGNLGSVEVEVTTAGVSTRQTYFPFGAVRSSGTNNLGTDRTYTDQIDDGTGLMHYRARQYDPTLGRFTQPDTIIPDPTNSQDLNRYSYVRNNPIRYTDPSGNCPTSMLINDSGCQAWARSQIASQDSSSSRPAANEPWWVSPVGFAPADAPFTVFTAFVSLKREAGLISVELIGAMTGADIPGDALQLIFLQESGYWLYGVDDKVNAIGRESFGPMSIRVSTAAAIQEWTGQSLSDVEITDKLQGRAIDSFLIGAWVVDGMVRDFSLDVVESDAEFRAFMSYALGSATVGALNGIDWDFARLGSLDLGSEKQIVERAGYYAYWRNFLDSGAG